MWHIMSISCDIEHICDVMCGIESDLLTWHWNPLGMFSYWQHTSQSCAHSDSRMGTIAFYSIREDNVQTESIRNRGELAVIQ